MPFAGTLEFVVLFSADQMGRTSLQWSLSHEHSPLHQLGLVGWQSSQVPAKCPPQFTKVPSAGAKSKENAVEVVVVAASFETVVDG